MYNKYSAGFKRHEIQGIDCWSPPTGFIFNQLTQKLEHIGVYERDTRVKHQYWEALPLLDGWKERIAEEEYSKETNPDYIDYELEEFRKRMWTYRLGGFWFKNNGVPTYITGLHWFYINNWKIDIGLPDYREPDREKFYFMDSMENDPYSMGMIDVNRRRSGKTFIAGAFLYNRVTKGMNRRGGIQSKNAPDARENVFDNAVIRPFLTLPEYFKPNYNDYGGAIPTNNLSFFHSPRVRKKDIAGKSYIGGGVNYRAPKASSYDGKKLHGYVCDEASKLEIEYDLVEIHNVIRWCLMKEERLIGKALYTTTTEEMGGGASLERFRQLWDDSDQLDRTDNGFTTSGLYRYYTPAYRGLYFNKYGFPDEVRAKTFFLNERKAVENRPMLLNSTIRKNSFSIEEAFRSADSGSAFNTEKLNIRDDFLSWKSNEQLYKQGNFVWKNGERDTHVVFQESDSGRFLVAKELSQTNNIKTIGGFPTPGNSTDYVVGVDTYGFEDVELGNTPSDASIVVYQRGNCGDEWDYAPIATYRYRTLKFETLYEDILRVAHYYGAPILFETNKGNIQGYFEERGYGKFLIWLPGKQKPGIYAGGHSNALMFELLEAYVEDHTNKLVFPDLVKELLKFNPAKTQKFDTVMAFGYSLMADKYKKERTVKVSKEAVRRFVSKKKVKTLH